MIKALCPELLVGLENGEVVKARDFKEVPEEAQEVEGVEITGNPGIGELVLMIFLLGLENPRMVNKWSSFDCLQFVFIPIKCAFVNKISR